MKTLTRLPESATEASLRQQALDAMQAAWKAIRRMEDLSDDPAQSKSAGIAVSFLNKAFHELEPGKR